MLVPILLLWKANHRCMARS